MFKNEHQHYWKIVLKLYLFSLFFHSLNSIYSTGIGGYSHDIKTWPLADLSGYFVIGYDSSTAIAKICKYTFSSSSAQCQTISNIYTGYGHLMISNSQFFVLGGAASPYNLQMYKISFSSTSVNWANQIACASGTWLANLSESLLSSDGSTIYSFFMFGSTYYLYFVGLAVADGSVVTARYKSSVSVPGIWGSTLNGDYVVAASSSPSLVMYSIYSSTFSIKSFPSGAFLFGWGVESSSGR